MKVDEEYKKCESEVLAIIKEQNLPPKHPFLNYPNTPESMPIKMIIIIYSYTKNKKMIQDFVKKCKGKENGIYSFKKYREGVSELIWLYYLIIGAMKSRHVKLKSILDENYKLIDNNYKFEYSLLFDNPSCIVAFEVKSLSCDPFEREQGIKIKDGQKIIKPFFPSLKSREFIKRDTDSIVLSNSTHYNQMVKNINRINKKCLGKNISGLPIYCFGVMFITCSTSFEEFYSYLFNEEYGLYGMIKKSKIDAVIIVSLDHKNDFYLNNLYRNGYVQTIIPHRSEELLKVCKELRLDNYIALENDINEYVKDKSKLQYGYYKILKRKGYVNIIPQEATESEIEKYIERLESNPF